MLVPFNRPTSCGNELKMMKDCIYSERLSGGGEYASLCSKNISKRLGVKSPVFMTASCTQSLEASCIILGLKPGDEVIMPSFTFVTTATSFAIRGIRIKFVDIRPDTLNIDENKIESAITDKTKAIVAVHYAGVACEMDKILHIASKHNLAVIEDAAQCMVAYYKGRHLGSIGDMSAFSFHDTKNIHCGEGGALVVNNPKLEDISRIVVNKGTNRSEFLSGNVSKYTWVGLGSSYSMGELTSSYLLAQLANAKKITKKRLRSWNAYYKNLKNLDIDLPEIPTECSHNAHIFHIRLQDKNERARLMEFLSNSGIESCFHFVPLHSSPAGMVYGEFVGDDVYTTKESERLLRLPLYDSISIEQVNYVCEKIKEYYEA